MPLATTYRLVDDWLSRHGLLDQGRPTGSPVGASAVGTGQPESPAVDLRQAAMPFMEDIQSVVRQHTQLAVLRDDEVLVIERLSSRGSVVNRRRLPAACRFTGLRWEWFCWPIRRTISGVLPPRHRGRDLGRSRSLSTCAGTWPISESVAMPRLMGVSTWTPPAWPSRWRVCRLAGGSARRGGAARASRISTPSSRRS